MLGFPGPNGAGKTTAIRILATLPRPAADELAGAPGVIAAVALVIASWLALSWVWAAIALPDRDTATFSGLGLAVLLPPMFASNIFVQPGTTPGWLQAFVKASPVSHVADAPPRQARLT